MNLLTILIFVCTFFIGKSSEENHNHEPKNTTNQKPKTKNSPIFQPIQPSQPQNCDLICPNQPPFALPPTFLQNCQPVDTSSTPKPVGAVTTNQDVTTSVSQKPSSSNNSTKNSTTSGVTSNTTETTEVEENAEDTSENPNERKSKKTDKLVNKNENGHLIKTNNKIDKHNNADKIELIEKHHYSRKQSNDKEHHNFGNKHYQQLLRTKLKRSGLKSQKVIFRAGNKVKVFGKKKHLNEKLRLDGCYVLCPDNQETVGQNLGPAVPAPVTDPTSNDYDSDNYVEGEDSPIEIIYVPPNIIQPVPPQIPASNVPSVPQTPPSNVPQVPPDTPQNIPQHIPPNIPQALGNIPQQISQIPQNILPQKIPFDFEDLNPFNQFVGGIPWDFAPFFRGNINLWHLLSGIDPNKFVENLH